MIARVAALAAIDARPASYLLNIEAANVSNVTGLTLEDAQGALIAIAPIVGTARTVSAATAIAEALGLPVAIEDAIEERQASVLTHRHSFAVSPQSLRFRQRPEDSWPPSDTPLGHARSCLLG